MSADNIFPYEVKTKSKVETIVKYEPKVYLFSTFDVGSDSNLSGEYLTRKNTFSITRNYSGNLTTVWGDNVPLHPTKWGECVPVAYNLDTNSTTFTCWDRDYYYGLLTLMFIYLPATFTIAAALGPKDAGKCAVIWGTVMMIIATESDTSDDSEDSDMSSIEFILILGGLGTFLLGCVLIFQQWRNTTSIFSEMLSLSFLIKFLLFPFLFIFSPLIFLYIKFLTIIKRDSKMIENQKKIASMGEAILEASPQYCLQMYIVLHTLDPTWSQWFSIITSVVTLNIPNIEKYYEPHELKDIIKKNFKSKTMIRNILLPTLVIVLNTFGKIMSISVSAVFFRGIILLIIQSSFFVAFFLPSLFIASWCQKMDRNKWRQVLEAGVLGFITQTNLGNNQPAKIVRIVVFYFSLIVYCSIVLTINIICNLNPDTIVIRGEQYGDLIWKDLSLVQNITILNIVCGLAIGCLILSWILDILCQFLADEGGVYHNVFNRKRDSKEFMLSVT